MQTDTILTRRETDIAIGYVDGLIGKEIAERNHISYNTVIRHTQNIYEKTGIRRSTNALVAWFLSVNFSINISEITRRIGAGCLLLLIGWHTLTTSNDQYVRRVPARRTSSARRTTSRRGRNENDLYTNFI